MQACNLFMLMKKQCAKGAFFENGNEFKRSLFIMRHNLPPDFHFSPFLSPSGTEGQTSGHFVHAEFINSACLHALKRPFLSVFGRKCLWV